MAQLSFICHSSQDHEIANKIVEKLEKAGIPCWVAPRNIAPGLTYAASIIKKLLLSIKTKQLRFTIMLNFLPLNYYCLCALSNLLSGTTQITATTTYSAKPISG